MMQMLSRFFVPKKLLAVLIVLVLLVGGIILFKQYPVPSNAASEENLARIAANFSGGFTADLDIDYGEFEADAKFEQRYVGDSSFRFTSPPSLDGFELTLSDGKVIVSYRGISSELADDQLFTSSGAGLFLQALGSLTDMQGLTTKTEDDVLELSRLDQNGTVIFSAQLDPVDGKLLEVQFPAEDFSAEVSNFAFLSAK